MLKDKTILIIGGDLRIIKLAELLCENNNVFCIGLENAKSKKIKHTSIKELILQECKIDYIILPLPTSIDNKTVNAPLSDKAILIEDILSLANCKTAILGGKISQPVKDIIGQKCFWYCDYLQREELSVLNSIPTAEGAIQIAMENTESTIFNSNCLIVGYGRIGKVLAPRLAALGANITISARKFSDIAWIQANGFTAVNNMDLLHAAKEKQLIFNTVPAAIINDNILKNIDKNALIIDLASKPGGVDFESAKLLGIKTIWALSLPGKVAPVTAGEMIYSTINNIAIERGFCNG